MKANNYSANFTKFKLVVFVVGYESPSPAKNAQPDLFNSELSPNLALPFTFAHHLYFDKINDLALKFPNCVDNYDFISIFSSDTGMNDPAGQNTYFQIFHLQANRYLS